MTFRFSFPLATLTLAAILAGSAIAADPPVQAAENDQPSAPASAKAHSRPRVRLGGVMVGVGYTRYSGFSYRYGYPYAYSRYPAYAGVGPYWYDPFWFGPAVYPGFYYGYAQGPNMGEIKIQGAAKNASVYLDGAFAGSAEKLKSIWLDPGTYNLEVRAPDVPSYERRVYVLSGKTLRVNTLEKVR